MATPYVDVVSLIRAAIGDFGVRDADGTLIANSNDYNSIDINSVITLALLKFSTYSGDGTNITPTVANDNDLGAITYYSALILVLPGGPFTLESPNMRYILRENVELISYLLGQMQFFIQQGAVLPSIWGAWDQLINEGQLVADRKTEATRSYSSSN